MVAAALPTGLSFAYGLQDKPTRALGRHESWRVISVSASTIRPSFNRQRQTRPVIPINPP